MMLMVVSFQVLQELLLPAYKKIINCLNLLNRHYFGVFSI